ncbi:putative xyloglucan endotransglucosylase/hydrolase protein 26 [Colletotrichum spinosum]|uniref:Putative xyloglucan endotransglucosylase/hydrolase protein 26 n=1 Tax=Colletotrichum spinosum TaxID=1347390 RepID=A0A4R8Q5C0_9PEZI|nr:putative xyloglucan endotransglucosylase/hydrolase protein 26 [Colletotrichum spinosum]
MKKIPAMLLMALSALPRVAMAACECGYAANSTDTREVYTDLIETDFTKIISIEHNTDWIRQEFNKSDKTARGPLGVKFMVTNVAAVHESAPPNGLGSDAGLRLVVKGSKYHNDTQEIDMEFLTREFNASNGTYPLNIVLQSRASLDNGYNAQGTGNFLKVSLGFNPTTDFHEYRIDYLRDEVVFYADNKAIGRMNGSAVPTEGGHLILQHWSNGNPLWSGGPPKQDAVLMVASARAYFNSSLDSRKADHARRCVDPSAPDAICTIPDDRSFFFATHANMTMNQTVSGQPTYGEDDGGVSGRGSASAEVPLWTLLMGVFALGLWLV